MMALLDTHCFLWSVIEPRRLSPKLRKIITDPTHQIHLSTISFWEIALKFALGKLNLSGCTPDELVPLARRMGLVIVAPTAEESAGFHRLPKHGHKDPFDRMLIWQCIQNDWTLLTRDGAFEDYRTIGLKTVW